MVLAWNIFFYKKKAWNIFASISIGFSEKNLLSNHFKTP